MRRTYEHAQRLNQYRNLRLQRSRRLASFAHDGDFDDFGREEYASYYHYNQKKARGTF